VVVVLNAIEVARNARDAARGRTLRLLGVRHRRCKQQDGYKSFQHAALSGEIGQVGVSEHTPEAFARTKSAAICDKRWSFC
jgi:hypothetical protein